MDREGRPRNCPALERLRGLVLVDDVNGQAFAPERAHARCELATEAAAGAKEDRQLGTCARKPGELRGGIPEGRTLLGELEGDPWADSESEETDLPVKGEHERRERD